MTGKSARPNIQESTYLPLLYDFEELEGELNFLNRVVALSFHPSARARTPITLGEVKVWLDSFRCRCSEYITFRTGTVPPFLTSFFNLLSFYNRLKCLGFLFHGWIC